MRIPLILLALAALTLTASAADITARAERTDERIEGLRQELARVNAAINEENNSRTNASPALPPLPLIDQAGLLTLRLEQVLDSYAAIAATATKSEVINEDDAFLQALTKASRNKRDAARAAAKAVLDGAPVPSIPQPSR